MRSISPNITQKTVIDATPLITPAEVGAWLNLSAGMVTLKTDLIEQLIQTVTEVVEDYTWLALRRTTYIAQYDLPASDFFSFFSGNLKLSLERAPILALADITKIEFLQDDGTYAEFDRGVMSSAGLYENTTEKIELRQWASVFFRDTIPFDQTRFNAYKVRITFQAGFVIPGDLITALPSKLKTGMLMVIASYYTNRGDCSDCNCDLNGYPVPCIAKGMIDQCSIAKTVFGGSYTPSIGDEECI